MTAWTDMTTAERIEAIRPLVRKNLSFAEMARALGTTKGAVQGMFRRHGAALKSTPKPRIRVVPGWRPTPFERSRPGQCRYIIWDVPGERHICGGRVSPGHGLWCEWHRRRVFKRSG